MPRYEPRFIDQIDRNFERVCVMDQRQFITMKLDLYEDLPEELAEYAGAVAAFNAAFDAHKSFEMFYTADMAHKTRENALLLDQKNDDLREKFLHVRRILFRIRT